MFLDLFPLAKYLKTEKNPENLCQRVKKVTINIITINHRYQWGAGNLGLNLIENSVFEDKLL